MTREEAIKTLQWYVDDAGISWGDFTEAFDMALNALRPVSREQVETAWKGCKHCTEEWGTCDPITNRFRMPPRGGIQFCPMCGRPITDEAVQMVMERLEKVYEQTSN